MSATGPISFADLGDALITNPARGDILYRNAAGYWVNLAAGTAGQLLQTGGAAGDPSWAAVDLTVAGGWTRTAGLIRPTNAGDRILVNYAPPASANYGLISLGGGPFDGATTGFFAGSAAG